MSYLLRYKVRPASGWIHDNPIEHYDAVMERANKLVVGGECCKVEVYQHILTGTPVEPQIKIEWIKDENREGISNRT